MTRDPYAWIDPFAFEDVKEAVTEPRFYPHGQTAAEVRTALSIYDWRTTYVDQPTDYQTALGRRLQPLVDRTMAILRRRGLLP